MGLETKGGMYIGTGCLHLYASVLRLAPASAGVGTVIDFGAVYKHPHGILRMYCIAVASACP